MDANERNSEFQRKRKHQHCRSTLNWKQELGNEDWMVQSNRNSDLQGIFACYKESATIKPYVLLLEAVTLKWSLAKWYFKNNILGSIKICHNFVFSILWTDKCTIGDKAKHVPWSWAKLESSDNWCITTNSDVPGIKDAMKSSMEQ